MGRPSVWQGRYTAPVKKNSEKNLCQHAAGSFGNEALESVIG